MKKNLPVTQNERVLAEGTELVSATDTKGRITHANPAFVEISGFAEDELVGSNHNIVRHPDMPPAAFQNLWDTLKRGRPWMGVVKNRCKSGDHYWVDAFVTPSLDGDDIVGYESVRVAPQRATVARAEALYKTLSGGNRPRFRLPTLSLAQRLSAGFALTSGLAIFGAAATMSLPLAGA
ncbi:MAG: PAS domain-containing protein, partial [Gammaproteobacteria bacterium]|nr:PAS domain-containing protein [Gammaproteobacteria bacterium]